MSDHRDLSGTPSWFAHNQSWGNPRHYWESFLCSTEQETDDDMRFAGRPGHILLGFSAPRAKKMPVDLRLTKWSESCSVMSDSLRPHGLYSPWNSPGQNTRVGSLSLLQGIFPTQGSSPGLLHCRQILYQLSHKESPRILEWVAYPFSSGSSQPRNGTWVS